MSTKSIVPEAPLYEAKSHETKINFTPITRDTVVVPSLDTRHTGIISSYYLAKKKKNEAIVIVVCYYRYIYRTIGLVFKSSLVAHRKGRKRYTCGVTIRVSVKENRSGPVGAAY